VSTIIHHHHRSSSLFHVVPVCATIHPHRFSSLVHESLLDCTSVLYNNMFRIPRPISLRMLAAQASNYNQLLLSRRRRAPTKMQGRPPGVQMVSIARNQTKAQHTALRGLRGWDDRDDSRGARCQLSQRTHYGKAEEDTETAISGVHLPQLCRDRHQR
jgi:hypothetical protein